LATPEAWAEHELLFSKPPFRGRFVEQKLMPSSSFRCYQIHNCHRYDFGHTLLCHLSRTWMFNKPTSEEEEEGCMSIVVHSSEMLRYLWFALYLHCSVLCYPSFLQHMRSFVNKFLWHFTCLASVNRRLQISVFLLIQNGAATIRLTTFSIMTLSITTCSITKNVTHSIRTHNVEYPSAEFHLLSAILLGVILLNVVMPIVVLLNVAVPSNQLFFWVINAFIIFIKQLSLSLRLAIFIISSYCFDCHIFLSCVMTISTGLS